MHRGSLVSRITRRLRTKGQKSNSHEEVFAMKTVGFTVKSKKRRNHNIRRRVNVPHFLAQIGITDDFSRRLRNFFLRNSESEEDCDICACTMFHALMINHNFAARRYRSIANLV